MDQWEFTYVELFQSSPGVLKQQKYQDHVEATKAAIARLGLDGWEPVGPISMLMGTKAGGYQHLMFKRKLGGSGNGRAT
jgi:hypothetical protein